MSITPISNKKSVLALVKETTQGLAVRPASGNDFTAMQDGFTLQSQFALLQNTELRASIGKAKDNLGAENPVFNMSHYIKASGIVGQKPDFGLLIESCLGAVVVDGTERVTVAGSTSSTLNVGAGLGVNYQRGQAALVQIPGGYALRNVLSVAGDVLTLGQNLATPPGAGVLLGRAILYKVLDEGHPSLSIWNYRGNGGMVEMITGARVVDMNLDFTANAFINGAFILNGIGYSFNPIKIGPTNKFLDYTDDSGAHTFSIAEKEYKSPHQLAEAIQSAINALAPVAAITVTYDDVLGKFNFLSAGIVFTINSNTGAHAANGIMATLGFTVAADQSGALTYTSNNAQIWAAPFTPVLDQSNANVAKALEVMMGDPDDITCFGAQKATVKVVNTNTDIPDLCEETGRSGSLFTARTITIDIVATLAKNDVDRYKRFVEGLNTGVTINAGVKSGGQWVKGGCVNVYIPTASITSFEVVDQAGLIVLNTQLTAYVDSGLGEFYINFI